MTVTHKIFKDNVEVGYITKVAKIKFADYSTDKFTYAVCLITRNFEGRDALKDAIWDGAYHVSDDGDRLFYHHHTLDDIIKAIHSHCTFVTLPANEFDTPNPAIIPNSEFAPVVSEFSKIVVNQPTNILVWFKSIIQAELHEREQAHLEDSADYLTNYGQV